MIFEGSRYQGIPATAIRGEDGKVRKILRFREGLKQQDAGSGFVVHTVSGDEMLDHLAFRYAGGQPGKESLWWLIADVNDIYFPFELEKGKQLIIPTGLLQARQGM